MAEVKRGTSVGLRLRRTFQRLQTTQGSSLSADIFGEQLSLQIRLNPLDTNDKRYCESFMLNIREI